MELNDFDTDAFLRDYWQKKPLLIRNPWNDWKNPLTPDALAGLACEQEVEARLIVQENGNWVLEHGPLPLTRFAMLGEKNWTLLVQAVDIYEPDVAALMMPFRFIPNWRIDDIMVSYASDGGGVGPHFDQYDVFLVQGLGQRRWQIGGICDDATELLPNDDLRLLADFTVLEEWVLEPGDILYIPPRIAHNGIAQGPDCMTYSVGFRAPSRSELITQYCDSLLDDMPDDDRYCDADLTSQDNAGEISGQAIERLHNMVVAKMGDRSAFARWFGQYNSAPKYPDLDWTPETPMDLAVLKTHIRQGVSFNRNPASRFSFIRQSHEILLLFVDGDCFECGYETVSFAEYLCASDCFMLDTGHQNSNAVLELLITLINRGCISLDTHT